MARRVVVSGVLGAIVLIVWAFIANAILGLGPGISMRTVANERQVYDLLKANVEAPGGYIVNPPLDQSGAFTGGEPVFSLRYSGVGHESAGIMLLFELAIAFIAAMIAAALLWIASDRVRSSYLRRVMFFSTIGLLIGIFSDLTHFGIGGHPLSSALLLAANSLVSWTLVGLAVSLLYRSRTPRTAGA